MLRSIYIQVNILFDIVIDYDFRKIRQYIYILSFLRTIAKQVKLYPYSCYMPAKSVHTKLQKGNTLIEHANLCIDQNC